MSSYDHELFVRNPMLRNGTLCRLGRKYIGRRAYVPRSAVCIRKYSVCCHRGARMPKIGCFDYNPIAAVHIVAFHTSYCVSHTVALPQHTELVCV